MATYGPQLLLIPPRPEPPPGWDAENYEYEREQMLDAAPSTESGDYFEEIGYDH